MAEEEDSVCSVTTAENVSEISEFLEMMLGPKQMDDYHTLMVITLFYTTVFVTGILGNLSVCLVIFRSSHLHTAMNYYLVSLAVADLMIIILGNSRALFIVWYCKLLHFLWYICCCYRTKYHLNGYFCFRLINFSSF